MELILVNGKIKTPEGFAQAVAVENGRVARVGASDEILALKEEKTKVVDLGGKLVLPGLNDSHMHFLNVGYFSQSLDLGGTKSLEEAVELAKKFLEEKQLPPGKWLEANTWNDDNWAEKRFPTKEDLDRISTDRPVLFVRVCGHISVVNSKGLELIGIHKGMDQPKEGEFVVDESGEPTGVLKEMMYRVYESIPNPTVEDIKKMLLDTCEEALKVGLTSVQTDDFESIPGNNLDDVIRAYTELTADGKLPLRVYEQCALPSRARYKLFVDHGYRSGQGNEFFRLGPIKLFCDGSLGARTAWLSEPYSDDPSTCGFGIYDDPAELFELVEKAHKAGMAAAIHCIGDAAAEQAVEAIERAVKKYPETKLRHGIVHAQILNPQLMEKIRELDIIAYIQPIFIEYDLHMAESRVGSERIKYSYNWKDLLKSGVRIPFGTDCPVESFDPMPNIYSAVTRKDLEGQPEEGWHKEQGLTLEEAIAAYTEMPAYASYEENIKGKIAPGFLADFTVLERDLYEIPADEIKDVKTAMTIVDGKIRYERGNDR